jgi:hypothetical protein
MVSKDHSKLRRAAEMTEDLYEVRKHILAKRTRRNEGWASLSVFKQQLFWTRGFHGRFGCKRSVWSKFGSRGNLMMTRRDLRMMYRFYKISDLKRPSIETRLVDVKDYSNNASRQISGGR